jgi:hemerythrin
MTKHIKISDENHRELMELIGKLQMERKRRVTIDEAIDFLLKKVKEHEKT